MRPKEYVLDELTWTDGQVIFCFSSIMSLIVLLLFWRLYVYNFYRIWNRKYGAPVLAIATINIIPIMAAGTAGLFIL